LDHSIRAEFLKIWAMRFPRYGGAGLIVFIGLITYELFAGEHLAGHVHCTSALTLMPYLIMATWGNLFVIPLYLMGLAAYCMSIDSQYGMIRVGCSQPLSRVGYIASKSIAILLHSALFVSAYFFLLLVVSAIAGRSITAPYTEVAPILASYLQLLIFCVSFAWLVAGAALFRHTLLESFVSAILVIVALVWLNMMPMHFGLNPYLLLRYYLYPVSSILRKEWLANFPNLENPLWQFLLTMIATPAIVWGLALARFVRRDITE
jgi:ABC-type transport system involved in multi-copper enzyme maturation permease subunit